MEPVSILISNRNSFEAIQLCVESIRKYTEFPYAKIIVCDENSGNGEDREYLRECHRKGWLELIEESRLEGDWEHDRTRSGHAAPYWHGKALNILVNGACLTNYAVLMDCDVWIKESGWLEEFYALGSPDDVLAVGNITPYGMQREGGYVIPAFDASYAFLNMRAYRDMGMIDWVPTIEDRRKEPYASFFADVYPPEKTGDWQSGRINREKFHPDECHTDPGSKFFMKATWGNPKGYKIIKIPHSLYIKHRHFQHISVNYMTFDIEHKEHAKLRAADWRLNLIKTELQKLRIS